MPLSISELTLVCKKAEIQDAVYNRQEVVLKDVCPVSVTDEFKKLVEVIDIDIFDFLWQYGNFTEDETGSLLEKMDDDFILDYVEKMDMIDRLIDIFLENKTIEEVIAKWRAVNKDYRRLGLV
jgi:hypothetical protein